MAQALPDVDTLLGSQTAAPAIQQPNNLPDVDTLLSKVQTSASPINIFTPVISAARSMLDIKQVQDTFMSGIRNKYEGQPSYGLQPEDVKDMQKSGFFNDHAQNEDKWYKNVNEAFISSAASAADFITRPVLGAMNAIPQVARKIGDISGIPGAGKEAQFVTEAIPENFPLGARGSLGFAEDAPLIQRAIANHAVATDDVFLNPAKASPEQETAAQAAATESPVVAATSPWKDQTQPAAPLPTVHDVVRQDNPALFNEWDRLNAERDTYGRWNRELAAKRQEEIEPTSPYATQLEQAKMNVEQKATKNNLARLNDIQSKHDEWVANESAKVTPDMAQVQAAYHKADERMKDMAQDVSAAYRAAQEKMPKTEEPIVSAPVETKPFASPWERPKPEEQGSQNAPKTIEEQHQNIVADITQKATAAGYGKDEASAGAEILARQYRYLADVYGGKKGNAEELYKKEGPKITSLTAKAQGRELAQGTKGAYAPAENGVRGIIRMFKSADASTLIHEGAHHFLNMLKRYEALEDAPAKLKEDMNVIRNWLGVKEDGIFNGRHEEKFARGWEKYVMEGHAPSKPLIEIFQKFEKWLTDIYGTVKNIPHGQLSDAVRNFFDRVVEPNAELRNNPRNTIVAGEQEPGKAIADIHEADAEHTPPAQAATVRDNIEKEIDSTAKLHNPEIADAIKSAEQTTNIQAEATGDTGASTATQSAARGSIAPQEPAKVAGSSGQAGTESSAARTGINAKSGERSGVTEGDKRADNPHKPLPKSESTFVDKAGNVRLENITSNLTTRDAIREVWLSNPEIMEAARRGVVSDQMVSDIADSLGIEARELNMQKLRDISVQDQIPLAARILSGRRILRESAQNIKSLWEKMASGNEAIIMEYAQAKARHLMIAETVSAITAEWGRAGRAFQDISKEDMAETGNITELLQRSLNTTPEKLLAEADAGRSLKTEAQVAKFLKKSVEPDFFDKLIEYRNNCLLSGPITHLHYIEGGFINALYTPLIQIPAAVAAQRVMELAGKEIPEDQRMHLGESGAMLYAMGSGSVRGYRAALHAWDSGRQITLPGEKTYGTTKGNVTPIEPQPTAIKGTAGRIINTPGRIINSVHAFQKTLRYEQNINALAYRQAMNEGLIPNSPEFTRRIAHLVDNPTSEMMDKATKSSVQQVYMEKVSSNGFIGKQMLAAQSTQLGRYLFPFVKIEYNIKKQAFLDNTVMGIASKDIRDNLVGINGADAQAMQIGKMVSGTAIAGVAAALASTGKITGHGPTNPAERNVWLLTHTPDSLMVGGVALPIRMFGTFGQIMSLGANVQEVIGGASDEDAHKLALSVTEHASRMAFDNGFMQNAKSTLDVLFDPTENADKFVRNSILQWMPGEVGLGQVANQVDPYMREANNMIDAARAKIPFASYGLPERFDMFGNPIMHGSAYDQYKNDPIVQKMQELHIGVGKLQPEILGVKLDKTQWANYSQLSGQLVYDRLQDTINNPSFDTLEPGMQKLMIHRAINQGRDAAKGTIKLENPDIIENALETKRQLLYGQ